eukprot:RCo042882
MALVLSVSPRAKGKPKQAGPVVRITPHVRKLRSRLKPEDDQNVMQRIPAIAQRGVVKDPGGVVGPASPHSGGGGATWGPSAVDALALLRAESAYTGTPPGGSMTGLGAALPERLDRALKVAHEEAKVRGETSGKVARVMQRVSSILEEWTYYEDNGQDVQDVEALVKQNLTVYLDAVAERDEVYNHMFREELEEGHDSDYSGSPSRHHATPSARSQDPPTPPSGRYDGLGSQSQSFSVSRDPIQRDKAKASRDEKKAVEFASSEPERAPVERVMESASMSQIPQAPTIPEDLISDLNATGVIMEDNEDADEESSVPDLSGSELTEALRTRLLEAKYALMRVPDYAPLANSKKLSEKLSEMKTVHRVVLSRLKQSLALVQRLSRDMIRYLAIEEQHQKRQRVGRMQFDSPTSTQPTQLSMILPPGGDINDAYSRHRALADARRKELPNSQKQVAPVGLIALVFTDIQDSTRLWDQQTTAMKTALNLHNTLMRELIVQCKGYEVKTEGDAFMVTFQEPEDALRWCVKAQLALLDVKWPSELRNQPSASREVDPETGRPFWNGLRVRMGIHMGSPMCETDPHTKRMDYFGPVVNCAARVAATGRGGEIVVSEKVYRKVESRLSTLEDGVWSKFMGSMKLKGISDEIGVYRMIPNRLIKRLQSLPDPSAVDIVEDKADGKGTTMVDGWNPKFTDFYVQAKRKQKQITNWISYTSQMLQSFKPDTEAPEKASTEVTLVGISVCNAVQMWEWDSTEMHQILLRFAEILQGTATQLHGYPVRWEADTFLFVFEDAVNAFNFTVALHMALLNARWPEQLVQWAQQNDPRYVRDVGTWGLIRASCAIHYGVCIRQENAVTRRTDYQGPNVNRCVWLLEQTLGGLTFLTDKVEEKLRMARDPLHGEPVFTPVGTRLFGASGSESIPILCGLPRQLARRSADSALKAKPPAMASSVTTLSQLWVKQREAGTRRVELVEQAKRLLEEQDRALSDPGGPAPA